MFINVHTSACYLQKHIINVEFQKELSPCPTSLNSAFLSITSSMYLTLHEVTFVAKI